jgi:hypothetical protein
LVTWLAAREGDVAEVHVVCPEHSVLAVWNGNPAALDGAPRGLT